MPELYIFHPNPITVLSTIKSKEEGSQAKKQTKQNQMLKAASSLRISASPSIFLSWVTSSRSPRLALSLSSSIALSWKKRQSEEIEVGQKRY